MNYENSDVQNLPSFKPTATHTQEEILTEAKKVEKVNSCGNAPSVTQEEIQNVYANQTCLPNNVEEESPIKPEKCPMSSYMLLQMRDKWKHIEVKEIDDQLRWNISNLDSVILPYKCEKSNMYPTSYGYLYELDDFIKAFKNLKTKVLHIYKDQLLERLEKEDE